MGVVHLARRDDGERVALKVLRPQVVGDEDGRARLDREVDSLSRVHSRWVAEIVDAGLLLEALNKVLRHLRGPHHRLQELADLLRLQAPNEDLLTIQFVIVKNVSGLTHFQ